MGLEGYLEDLDIGEILQIVSLSKKSGTLSLFHEDQTGSITFQNGQVVRASSSQFPEALGQLLVREKIVSEQQVERALTLQRERNTHQPLGAILADLCQIPATLIEQTVSRRIESIVFSFFNWTVGTFSFQVGDPGSFGSASLNPLDFMLEKGLSSQRLVIKGKRITEKSSCAAEDDDASLELEVKQLEKRMDDRNLQLLRGMLAELDNPYIGGGIIMLLLRYASEVMSRAILFDVRNDQLVGLGQFGLTRLSVDADQIVRKLRLKIEPSSLFERVLHEKRCLCTRLSDTSAEKNLVELLGGVPEKVFLGPLVSDGVVVAMLYGDNRQESCPGEIVTAFEIFLSQAGMAMEQSL